MHGLFSSADAWKPFRQLIPADPQSYGVVTHCFEYDSPKFRVRLDRRIAEVDDLADSLRTTCPEAHKSVLAGVVNAQGISDTECRIPVDLVWRLLNAHSNRWLLVFDNADNPKAPGAARRRRF